MPDQFHCGVRTLIECSMRDTAQVHFGETVKLVGSSRELGGWDTGAAPELAWTDGDVWTTTVELPPGDVHFKVA